MADSAAAATHHALSGDVTKHDYLAPVVKGHGDQGLGYHGSWKGTSGRVRHGPAAPTLRMPSCAFESDTKTKVG